MASAAPFSYTLALIKPDAFPKREEIMKIVEENCFKIVKSKETTEKKEHLGQFYAEHKGKPFYDELCEFMASGPLVAMVLSKENAVPEWRKLIGLNLFLFHWLSLLLLKYKDLQIQM